jgi:hypothetical protein
MDDIFNYTKVRCWLIKELVMQKRIKKLSFLFSFF